MTEKPSLKNKEVAPNKPVQMKVIPKYYESNTYRKYLTWLHFDDEPWVQERLQVKNQQSCITVFVATASSVTLLSLLPIV